MADQDDDYVPASRASSSRKSKFGGCLRLPEGISFWKKTDGNHTFRLIPYVVGKHNEAAEEGKRFHTLTYWQHANIGPDGIKVLCPKQMRGAKDKRCAVCELRAQMIANGESQKETDQLKPKERSVFIVLIDGEAEPQVYDDSYHAFSRALSSAIELGEDGEYDMIAHPSEGAKLVKAKFKETPLGPDKSWSPAESVNLSKDAEPLTKSQKNHGICLDDCLVWPKYEELADMLLGKTTDEADDEDDDLPAKKPAKRPPVDDDDDEDQPPARKKKPVDDDEDPPPAKKKRPVDDDDEDPPPAKKKAPAKKPAEDDWDEDPPPAKKPTKRPPVEDDDEDPPPAKKPTKRPPVEDDDEDPPPAKKAAKKPAPAEDDWD